MSPRALPPPGPSLAGRVVDALGGRVRGAVPPGDLDDREPAVGASQAVTA